MTRIAPDQRQRVLAIASQITARPSDAAGVVRNATPLLAWLQDAKDEADLDLRLGALDQMYENLETGAADAAALAAAAAVGTTAIPFLEDAAGFVTSAEMLYLVAIADTDFGAGFGGITPEDITGPAGREHSPRPAAGTAEPPARHNARGDVSRRASEVHRWSAAKCTRPGCGELLTRDHNGQWWAPLGPPCGSECDHIPDTPEGK